MTRADLITHFRELSGDTVSNPYLWSDTLLSTYSVLAEEEACSRKPLLTSSTDETMCEIDITADTSTYAKHTAVRQVYKAVFEPTVGDPIELYITDKDELELLEPDWINLTGEVEYLILEDKTVQMVPAPTKDGVLRLYISHIPLTAETSFTIDSAHHFMLVFYMLYLAYSKHDADKKDPEKAARYEAIFTSYFGPRPSAYAIKSVRQVRPERRVKGWI